MKIFITGISSGIGKALAKRLVVAGHIVWGVARRKELLDQMQSELGADKLLISTCNLANIDEMKAVAGSRDIKHGTPSFTTWWILQLRASSLLDARRASRIQSLAGVRLLIPAEYSVVFGHSECLAGAGAARRAPTLYFANIKNRVPGRTRSFLVVGLTAQRLSERPFQLRVTKREPYFFSRFG